jgi:hypothetical protein
MVYKVPIRKRKTEQHKQSCSDINNGLQSINQKCKTKQQGKAFQRLTKVYKGLIRKRKIVHQKQSFSEIYNGLQITNYKRDIEQQEQSFSDI